MTASWGTIDLPAHVVLRPKSTATANVVLKSRFVGAIEYDWAGWRALELDGTAVVFDTARDAIDHLVIRAKLRAYEKNKLKKR